MLILIIITELLSSITKRDLKKTHCNKENEDFLSNVLNPFSPQQKVTVEIIKFAELPHIVR